MRSSLELALVLGLTGLGTACSGEGNGPSNAPPVAAFTATCVLLDCTFADASSDADGQVEAYIWDFGDGTPAAITRDGWHTFAAANTYIVSLTVTDDDGAAAGVTKAVEATAAAPQPASPTIAIQRSIVMARYGLCYPATGGNRSCGPNGALSISNTGGGVLNWAATKDAGWLTITPKSGTAPSTLTVSANGTGVPPGTYYGHVQVSAMGATNSPLTVTVRFTRR